MQCIRVLGFEENTSQELAASINEAIRGLADERLVVRDIRYAAYFANGPGGTFVSYSALLLIDWAGGGEASAVLWQP
jgi:hypothetical protein